jgi:hypothetical protein
MRGMIQSRMAGSGGEVIRVWFTRLTLMVNVVIFSNGHTCPRLHKLLLLLPSDDCAHSRRSLECVVKSYQTDRTMLDVGAPGD